MLVFFGLVICILVLDNVRVFVWRMVVNWCWMCVVGYVLNLMVIGVVCVYVRVVCWLMWYGIWCGCLLLILGVVRLRCREFVFRLVMMVLVCGWWCLSCGCGLLWLMDGNVCWNVVRVCVLMFW